MRLPTLKAIMAEKKCTIELARTYRAMMEADADMEHFRKTGKHLLPVVSARDLERHPELAVQDTIRPKPTEWKVDDHLKTPEACVAYIRAAAEEGTPDAVPDAFGDVFRALGMPGPAAYCDGLAAYLRTVGGGKKPAVVKPITRRVRPAKRELTRA